MNEDEFRLSHYDYELPESAIAQYPPERRENSRLLLVERKSGLLREAVFADFPGFLSGRDTVVFNDTRVVPARLLMRRPTGGRFELLIVARRGERRVEAITRGRAREGLELAPEGPPRVPGAPSFHARLLGRVTPGTWLVEFSVATDEALDGWGLIPLPPYIRRAVEEGDLENYQTVYAGRGDAVAAPTAGLHFTDEVLAGLSRRGAEKVFLTLHVGWGTFRPVRENDIRGHRMDPERWEITPEAAGAYNRARREGRRVTAVGTTVVRTLEACLGDDRLEAGTGEADIEAPAEDAPEEDVAEAPADEAPEEDVAEAPAEEAVEEEAAEAPAEEMSEFARMVAEGDVQAGSRVWNQCRACHVADAEQNRVGPHLVDIVGRQANAVDGFRYSGNLPDVVWTLDELDAYLENPRGYAPGTSMAFNGLRNVQDRANVMAYIESLN